MATSMQHDRRLDDPANWVDEYGDMMLSFAMARIGRRDVAEDLVQDTFLAAWRARDSFDGLSQRGTWLIGILRRKITDHFRAGGRTPKAVPMEQGAAESGLFNARGKWVHPPRRWTQTPDKTAEDAEFWRMLARCMSDLPVHLAQAFRLRDIGLNATNEICRMEGITPKNLSVRLHRARLALRECLERHWFCNDPPVD